MSEKEHNTVESVADAANKLIPKTVKQIDGVLSTVVGLFNNVVLYPVKKANMAFKYKLEHFEQDLKVKVKNISPENLREPPLMLAGPILESLKYTYDEEALREMYENLLASAMDSSKVNSTHPSFVDAIKQMSPLDAQVLSKIVDNKQLRCAEITFDYEQNTYVNGMPKYFVLELFELADPFLVSASISNLARLSLIEVTQVGFIDADYEELKNHQYVKQREEKYRELNNITVNIHKHAIVINDYGKAFARACMNKEI